jgi:hypothetical protein
MIYSIPSAPAIRRTLLFATAVMLAGPAFAHHVGPSGGQGGEGATVFGPQTLDEGAGAAWLSLVYTRPDQRSDAALEALAAGDIDAHNTRYDLNAAAGLAYGVTHRLTLSVQLPYVRHDHVRMADPGEDVERLGSVAGFGDTSVLAKYRLAGGEHGGLALIGGLKLPTGATHRRDAFGERFETEHQPGSGSWDPIVGASAGAKLGAVNLAASALYEFAGHGAQATRLGDRLQGGIALSHRFGPAEEAHEHEEHEHGEAHHHHHHESSWDAFVELGGEWEGRQTIAGEVEQDSGGKWAWLAPGVTFNAASGWSATAAVVLPVAQDIRPSHPDNGHRVMLSLSHGW